MCLHMRAPARACAVHELAPARGLRQPPEGTAALTRARCCAQTAEIAAQKAALKVQEAAGQAYEVGKQKAGEAYMTTAEYLKEKARA